MENKKKSFSNILIVLVVLLVGAGGIFVGTKIAKGDLYITKINATSEEKHSTSGPLEVESKLAQYLYSIVSDVGTYTMKPWMFPDKDKILASDLTEEEKMALVLKNLPLGRFNSNFTQNLEPTKTVNDSPYVASYNESDGFIDKEIVEITYAQIFGEKSSYNPSTVMYGDNRWTVYVYGKDTVNNQEGYFKYNCDACGGTWAATVKKALTKAEYYNSDIRLYETVITTDVDGSEEEQKVLYTFKKDKEDGMYHFYSREVQ